MRSAGISFLTRPANPGGTPPGQMAGTPRMRAVLEVLLGGSLWDLISPCFTHEKVRMAFARADDAGPANRPGSALAEICSGRTPRPAWVCRTRLGLPGKGHGRNHRSPGRAGAGLTAEAIRLNAPVRRILPCAGDAPSAWSWISGEIVAARRGGLECRPQAHFSEIARPRLPLSPAFRQAVEGITTRASYAVKFPGRSVAPAGLPGAAPRRAPGCPPGSRGADRAVAAGDGGVLRPDAQQGRLPPDPIMSCHLPSAYWPPPRRRRASTVSAPGCAGLRPDFADGSTWEDRRGDFTARILEILEGYAPGFAASVEWCRLLTPADIERETGITDASIRHVDMTLDQMLDRRPLPAWSSYQSPVPDLWLCGSGTHPGGSVTRRPEATIAPRPSWPSSGSWSRYQLRNSAKATSSRAWGPGR